MPRNLWWGLVYTVGAWLVCTSPKSGAGARVVTAVSRAAVVAEP